MVKSVIYMVLSFVIRFLGNAIPKNKNIWIFGAWQGKHYSDNAKYLFEYVSCHEPMVKAIWITKSQQVMREVQSLHYRCYYYHSLKGIYYTYRAGVAVETEGEWDISEFLDYKKCTIIQLWHGMGYKAMRWNGNAVSRQQERFSSYYWMAPSKLYIGILTQLMQISSSKFYITGYPRNDTFIAKPGNSYIEKLFSQYPNAKWIIYMPTHRNFGKDNKHINLAALHNVDQKLKKNNVMMVYKPHFHELKNFLAYEDTFTNIILAKDENIWSDVYSYLHYFDLLITDYSSVATDFMCSGKPVVYFPYDIEEYKTGDASLNDYFYQIPGGPFCYSWDEVLKQTMQLIQNDTWKEEREECRKAYHIYNDGRNSERVYNAVLRIVNSKR